MTSRIEARWEALEPSPEKPVFQLLDAEHPLRFYIGRAMTGEFLFLLVDGERPPSVKALRSVDIESIERPDGKWALLLTLARPELSGLFSLLCEDLVSSSSYLPPGSPGSRFVCRRLDSWRLLLEKGQAALLGPSEVRGLFGELWILDRQCDGRHDAAESIAAWVGPFGADQDFQWADAACEVKTIHPDAASITISSENQLYSSSRVISLAVLSLAEGPSGKGMSLNGAVARLRSRAAEFPDARDALEDRLAAAGYLARSEYDLPVFRVVGARMFSVDESFPRIAPPTLPSGVADVRYQIFLAACAPHEIECPFDSD